MEPISEYNRQQAIEDGVLVDVTESQEAKEAGFRVPVCITCGAWHYVQVADELAGIQDQAGRLWDTLYLAVIAFKRSTDKYLVPFDVSYMTGPCRREIVTLWLCFNETEGFTVMLPSEY